MNGDCQWRVGELTVDVRYTLHMAKHVVHIAFIMVWWLKKRSADLAEDGLNFTDTFVAVTKRPATTACPMQHGYHQARYLSPET